MSLSLVLPLYNEGAQLTHTIQVLTPILEGTGLPYEVICIDDGSTDDTWSILEAQHRADARWIGIRFSRNFGKEAALCAGLEAAGGEAVILMDADLQHPPELIQAFLALHQEGYEVIDGVKRSRGAESWLAKHLAGGFYRLFGRLSGVDLANSSDYKLLDRQVVDAWKALKERTTFLRGLTSWMGFKHTTVEFEVQARTHGVSKWSRRGLWRLAIQAILSFTAKPLQLLVILGGLFWIGALGLGIHTLVQFFRGDALGGFTTVILLELILGGSILFALGIIGLYIGQIYEEIKGRPRYLVAETLAETPLPKP